MNEYTGGCLCGDVKYRVTSEPVHPHLCSCRQCQKSTGAITSAWVGFPIEELLWDGPKGEPAYYRSSEKCLRGFCSKCGSLVCAVDDGSKNITLTIATLDDPGAVVPREGHSYPESAPSWWKVLIE